MSAGGYNLFLDDERSPDDVYDGSDDHLEDSWAGLDWVVAKTYTEFRQTLKDRGAPDRVSFDYVLGWDPNWKELKTGADCAAFLTVFLRKTPLRQDQVRVHSQSLTYHERVYKNLRLCAPPL